MNDYYCVSVRLVPWSDASSDFIAALLGDIGFDSFSVEDGVLKAYIPAAQFDENQLQEALDSFCFDGVKASAEAEFIEGEDWNSVWEKNYFNPIVVGGRVAVHSSFHTDVPEVEYDITVDPRMSFGTGHHQTTRLMLEAILELDLKGKSVIDMGTGTGILAMLCCMRGAADVVGIDIDPAAYANACDNAVLNHVNPHFLCGDASLLADLQPADLFLANINRNIILADLRQYVAKIKPGGMLITSGFYSADLPMIAKAAEKEGLRFVFSASDEDWTRAIFKRIN